MDKVFEKNKNVGKLMKVESSMANQGFQISCFMHQWKILARIKIEISGFIIIQFSWLY
jgi:hypothetical protein